MPRKTGTTTTRTPDVKTALRRHQKELEQNTKLLKELINKLNVVIENSPLTTGKKKRVKDPNRPKKNKNGYMFFCQENRSGVKTKNPGIDGKDLVKILSGMWNQMTDVEKAPYQAKASKDKVRYQQDMVVYNKKKAAEAQAQAQAQAQAS